MNYKNFYNSWVGFAKGKRQLLLEEASVKVLINPVDFLLLTTNSEELQTLLTKPRIGEPFSKLKMGQPYLVVEIDNSGNAKVKNHSGRSRAVAFIKSIVGELTPNNLESLRNNEKLRNSYPVKIQATNRDVLESSEIKKFIGQYTGITIPAELAISNQEDNVDNTTEPAPYAFRAEKDNDIAIDTTKESVYNHIRAMFAREGEGDYLKFVSDFNKEYKIVDSENREYSLQFVAIQPLTGKPSRRNILNLNPHPIDKNVYGSLEDANKRTYSIKKQ